MTEPLARRPVQRRDAAENRARLLDAAREVFGTLGPDAPFEEIARVAGVSRTTLHRNFTSREELAVAVYENNVMRNEEKARSLLGQPDGIVALFDFVLDTTLRHRGFSRVLMRANVDWARELGPRSEAAFELLLSDGIAAGVVRPGVGVDELMTAVHMADAAMTEDLERGAPSRYDVIARLLRTALFTTEN